MEFYDLQSQGTVAQTAPVHDYGTQQLKHRPVKARIQQSPIHRPIHMVPDAIIDAVRSNSSSRVRFDGPSLLAASVEGCLVGGGGKLVDGQIAAIEKDCISPHNQDRVIAGRLASHSLSNAQGVF